MRGATGLGRAGREGRIDEESALAKILVPNVVRSRSGRHSGLQPTGSTARYSYRRAMLGSG